MEISSKSMLDGGDGLAIGLTSHHLYHRVGHVTVAPVLAAVLEAQMIADSIDGFISREKLVK